MSPHPDAVRTFTPHPDAVRTFTPHPDAVRTFRGLLIAVALVAPFWAVILWSLA